MKKVIYSSKIKIVNRPGILSKYNFPKSKRLHPPGLKGLEYSTDGFGPP